VTGLLPHIISDQVRNHSISVASGTFGIVPLVACILLLVGLDIGRLRGWALPRRRMMMVVSVPLAVVAVLTIAARAGQFLT
jgi:hypothetical protein